MVQREVGERIAAPPGRMSYLSVFVQYHARVRIAFQVPPTAFEPEPAVGLGGHRRRAVRRRRPAGPRDRGAALAPGPGRVPRASQDDPQRPRPPAPVDGKRVTEALAAAGIDPDRRPQTLAVGEWLALREAIGPIGDGPARPGPRRDDRPTGADAGRPGRPGQAQPDPRGHRPPRPMASTTSTRCSCRSPWPTGSAWRPRTRAADSLHVAGLALDAGPDNLVLRAIAATRRAVGGGWSGGPGPAPAVAARLEKRIPVAGRPRRRVVRRRTRRSTASRSCGAPTLDEHARLAVAAGLGSDVPFFAAGGPALVEGRGERVTPLDRPARRARHPAGDAGRARVHAGRVRGVRRHPRHGRRLRAVVVRPPRLGTRVAGLSAADLAARAGVMAAANDLLPAVALVLPELVPFRRALTRLLHRPIGLSGSGPTLWAVYPSLTEAAEAAATVPAAVADGVARRVPGDGPPFVTATTIASTLISLDPTPAPEDRPMTRDAIQTDRRTRRGRPVQPGHRRRRLRLLLRAGRPRPGHRRARRGRHRSRDRGRPGEPHGRPRGGRLRLGRRRSRARSS